MTPAHGRDDAGGVALLTVLAGTLFCALGLLLVVAVSDVAATLARARTAADAAALAAAGAAPLAGGDGDARAAAAELAQRNGARLVDCCGGPTRTRVVLRAQAEVAVTPRSSLVRSVVRELPGRAAAALYPTGEGVDLSAHGPGRRPPDVGELAWPAAGPVTSGYGFRTHPITGARRLHAGLDIGAPTGTPVHAAGDGVVSFAGWRGGYGKTVIVDHGAARTLYAHQSEIHVRAGQSVRRGEPIGRVGSTGMSTGPHLHFEVRRGGRARDPRPFLE